jgi:predicted Zn-dependent protease
VQYENPKVPEGINVTPEHPLKEFAQLLFGILAVTVIVVVALALAAEQIARHIPFRMELDIAGQYRGSLPPRGPVTEYLQALADRLAAAQDLPAGMPITVHYVDEDTVNAFATIGGNVVFFRGLVEKMPSENALAMVMAHEIGHIQHRHPIMSLGRGVVVGLGLAAVTNLSGSNVVGTVLNDAGLLTVFSFTRQQEEEADRTALAALARHYGHVSGADEFFTTVQNLPDHQIKQKIPAFLSTHPATQDRIEKLRALAQRNGWAMDRPIRPIPETVQALVKNKTKAPLP